jgi:Core-2/I-Branching enzyme
MPSIGFILLTHANELQVRRLIHVLNQLFDDPPIACHHDFSKAPFQTEVFPGNVHFVRPHFKTRWGSISLVHATLRALRLLYDKSSPDWFYLLSGSDYPIKHSIAIKRELAESRHEAYIRLRKVDHARVPPWTAEDSGGLDSPNYVRLAYQRYIGRSIPIPSWRHPFRGPAAKHLHLLTPTLLRPFHPPKLPRLCWHRITLAFSSTLRADSHPTRRFAQLCWATAASISAQRPGTISGGSRVTILGI